ncbi:MAG: hypothetical protein WDL87_02080 [Candidatus Omnitrophota bacterium]|jgi:hypothetical protein
MMRTLKIIVPLIMIIITGCLSPDFNYEGLLTLKRLAAEQKETKHYLKKQEQLFNRLRKDFEKNKLQIGSSQEEIIARYGQPLSITQENSQENSKTAFYYRCPTQRLTAQEIYLYFNQEHALSDWHDNQKNNTKTLLH